MFRTNSSGEPSTPKKLWDACVRQPHSASAWEALFAYLTPLLRRRVVRLAYTWSISPDDVADLIQEVCLKLAAKYRQMRVPEPKDEFDAYVGKFIENATLDLLRHRYAQKRTPAAEIALSSLRRELSERRNGAANTVELNIWLREVDDALDASTRDRTVFWLYYRQGYTAKEIAGIPSLQISIDGVESIIHRLVVSLRNKFELARKEVP